MIAFLLLSGTKKRFGCSKRSALTSSLVGGVRLRDVIKAWHSKGRLTEATDENACRERRDH